MMTQGWKISVGISTTLQWVNIYIVKALTETAWNFGKLCEGTCTTMSKSTQRVRKTRNKHQSARIKL